MRHILLLLLIFLNSNIVKSQVTDSKVIDSIFKGLEAINARFEKTDLLIKNLRHQHEEDSLSLLRLNNKIFEFSTKIAVLEKDKGDLVVLKNESLNRLKDDSVAKANLADKQIEYLLNEKYDKQGNLVLSRSLLVTILNLAKSTTPKKLNQLVDYLDVYDTIAEIKKVFEKAYDSKEIDRGNKSLEKLELVVKQKFPNNKALMDEIESLKKVLNRYCSNTYELHLLFKNIYSLGKVDLSSGIESKSIFRKEIEQAYFLVFQYKYLNDMLNMYQKEPTYREQFKDKITFTCN